MKKYILFILVIVCISSVFASEIINNPITIRLYNNTIMFQTPYSINNQNYTFSTYNCSTTNNLTNVTLHNICISDQSYNFNNYFVYNGTFKLIDVDLTQQLMDCTNNKGMCNISLFECQNKLSEKQNVSIDYTNCLVNLKDRELTITNKDQQITQLNSDTLNKQNSSWLYAVIGFVAGVVGVLLFTGKLSQFITDKQKREFNPQQAG